MYNDYRVSMPKSNSTPELKKRKVSHAGSRQKGNRAEVEVVDIFNTNGIPAQRVVASGSFCGAKSDVKIGVETDEHGKMPERDSSKCIAKVEVKNLATNPEWMYTPLIGETILVGNKQCPEKLFDHLEQDNVSKFVVLKRARTPSGALKNKQYNRTHMVYMGLETFMDLFKKAYGKYPDA